MSRESRDWLVNLKIAPKESDRPEHWTIGVVEKWTGEVELDPVVRKINSDICYDIENAIDQEILGVFDVPMS